jgi:20S proteasome alpha/beta subunit
MSLTVAVKGPHGIALATDSRRVLQVGDRYATYDDEDKLWQLAPHVGAAFYGYGGLGCRLAPLRAAFAADLPSERLPVEEVAHLLGGFLGRLPHRLIAVVAGYDEDGTARVFVVDAPDQMKPVEHHAGGVGITRGGQREFVDRLLVGYDARVGVALSGVEGLGGLPMQIPLDRITLQGAVELAAFLVEMTREAQRFITGICGVGGSTDMATVTTDGFRWVRRKEPSETVPVWYDIGEATPMVAAVPADGIGAAMCAPRKTRADSRCR